MNGPQPLTPSQLLAARRRRRTGDQQKHFTLFNLMAQGERIEFVLEELLQLSMILQRLTMALDKDVPALERRIAGLEASIELMKRSLAAAQGQQSADAATRALEARSPV